MKSRLPIILLVLFSIQPFACSERRQEKTEILAEINDYKLTLGEFQLRLAKEMEMEKDFKLTREARKEFLEDIIRKELLIQEAKRLRLDKEENFMRTIEQFWESTLISNLMDIKGRDVCRGIVISEDEIAECYAMKGSGDKTWLPAGSKDEIVEELTERKKMERLKEWIDSLRKEAKVEINQDLLYKD